MRMLEEEVAVREYIKHSNDANKTKIASVRSARKNVWTTSMKQKKRARARAPAARSRIPVQAARKTTAPR